MKKSTSQLTYESTSNRLASRIIHYGKREEYLTLRIMTSEVRTETENQSHDPVKRILYPIRSRKDSVWPLDL